jgi:hypothetical protein
VGQTLRGAYNFDANGGESTDASTMRWTGGATEDTDSMYELKVPDVGRVLTYSVTAVNGTGVTGNTASLSTANATGVSGGGIPDGSIIDPTAKPIVNVTDITGFLQVGQTLTGVYSFDANGGAPGNRSFFEWLYGGHSDSDTMYLLDEGDVGKVLTFQVTAANNFGEIGNTASLSTANATGVSGGGIPDGSIIDPTAPASVLINGEVDGYARVGTQLTAEVTCVATCSGNLNYRWQIETSVDSDTYSDIGANTSSYMPVGGDQKRRIRVGVNKP